MLIYEAKLAECPGRTLMPADFEKFWNGMRAERSGCTDLTERAADFSTGRVSCREITYAAPDKTVLHAKYLQPLFCRPGAVVMDFHDIYRGTRGWHYLMRYAALGYCVFAPGIREAVAMGNLQEGLDGEPENMLCAQTYADAMQAVEIVKAYTGLQEIYTYGEGLGAAMAIAVSAMYQKEITKCSALNVLLADYRTVGASNMDRGFYGGLGNHLRIYAAQRGQEEAVYSRLDYLDCVNFAAMLRQGELLIGIGMLDEVGPAAAQLAVADRAQCRKRRLIYEKYGHERINFFETEHLKFMLKGQEA